MPKCTACGQETPEGATRCDSCGAELNTDRDLLAGLPAVKGVVSPLTTGLSQPAVNIAEFDDGEDSITGRGLPLYRDAIVKAKEEFEKRAAEEAKRAEEERKAAEEKAEAERKAKEEAERLAKEEAERKAAEEAHLAEMEAERKAAEEKAAAEAEEKRKAEEARAKAEAEKKPAEEKPKAPEKVEEPVKAEVPVKVKQKAVPEKKSGKTGLIIGIAVAVIAIVGIIIAVASK